MRFSERMGLIEIDKTIQIDGMNDDLSNSLWNLLYCILKQPYKENYMQDITECIYHGLLKLPVDTIPRYDPINTIRKIFFNFKFYEKYDFIEFLPTLNVFENFIEEEKYYELINNILERELSGYRFIDGVLSKIIDDSEIAEIKKSIDDNPYETSKKQIHEAIKKLSDKNNPDYRNSIKEAISAVEGVLRKITGENEFGKAISNLSNSGIEIPEVMKEGMKKFYGYTCGKDGIRHALMEDNKVSFDEAKYMLVICCTFINYLVSKSSKTS